MVDQNVASRRGVGIDQSNAGLLSFQVADLPSVRPELIVVLAHLLAEDLITDEELHGGLALHASSADQEADRGLLDREGGRGERTHFSWALCVGAREGLLGKAMHMAREHALAPSSGCFTKGGARFLPSSKAIALKGGEDFIGGLGGGRNGERDEEKAERFHRLGEASR